MASYFVSVAAKPSIAKDIAGGIDIHNVNETEEESYVGGLNERK